MTIIKRWLRKEFTEDNINKVDEVIGVFLLITESDYINFVCPSVNLRASLLHHFKIVEVPAKKFTAYQTQQNAPLAIDLADRLKKKYEPYYNLYTDNDYEKYKPIEEKNNEIK